MRNYDYESFKNALGKMKEDMYLELQDDIEAVKKNVENLLEKVFESSTFKAETRHPGVSGF
ncbi:MAG TPA: hypothetical protein PKI94_00635 [Candidatus Gastranaerophilaceae bacterium]|nr:hypothetical protein [Candidatus Gastranaerophilaceae bacterium]